MEGDFVIAAGGDLLHIPIPGLPRIEAQLLVGSSLQQVPRTFDIGGGERLAIVPLYAVTQVKGQQPPALVP